MRTLVIIIVLVLIVMIAKRLWQSPRPTARHNIKSGNMVPCASCGMYIPRQEALPQGDRFYCSQGHLDEDDQATH